MFYTMFQFLLLSSLWQLQFPEKCSIDSFVCVCVFQMKDGRWHQTHFLLRSQDPQLLPVVNIYNLPLTTPGSHYHLEVGPVCFL